MDKNMARLLSVLATATLFSPHVMHTKKDPATKEKRVKWRNRVLESEPGLYEYNGKVPLEDWLDANRDAILVVYSPSCFACKKTMPNIERYARAHDGEHLVLINAREYPGLAHKYKVHAVPTIIVLRDGKEVQRLRGYKTFQVLEKELANVELRRYYDENVEYTELP